MNILLLNGNHGKNDPANQILTIIQKMLAESPHKVKQYDLYQLNIAPCLGCFDCWLKNPGECIINDDGRLIARALIQHDVVIYFSPVTFGGYSSEMKKAMDRFIPNLLPFFQVKHNEIHHIPRYDVFPNILFIGTLPQQNQDMEKTFFQLNERNAINMDPDFYGKVIFYHRQPEDEIKIKFREVMKEVEL